jgi:hypothetical protein
MARLGTSFGIDKPLDDIRSADGTANDVADTRLIVLAAKWRR